MVDGPELDDEELTALALAADPDQEIGPGAVPIDVCGSTTSGLLPEWYMPAPMSAGRSRARRVMLGLFGLSLVVINAAGLCVAYGFPEIAW